jgi:hypothetical protein
MEQSTEYCTSSGEKKDSGVLPTVLSAFRHCRIVHHCVVKRRLGDTAWFPGPVLRALSPTWQQASTASSWMQSTPSAMGLGFCFCYDPKAMEFAPVMEGRVTNHCALHCPSSWLLKLFCESLSDPLPLHHHLSWPFPSQILWLGVSDSSSWGCSLSVSSSDSEQIFCQDGSCHNWDMGNKKKKCLFCQMLACHARGVTVSPNSHTGFKAYRKCDGFILLLELQVWGQDHLPYLVGGFSFSSPTLPGRELRLELQALS